MKLLLEEVFSISVPICVSHQNNTETKGEPPYKESHWLERHGIWDGTWDRPAYTSFTPQRPWLETQMGGWVPVAE